MTGELAGPTGDFQPAAIRAELHRMADWMADYRIGIAERSVSTPVQPGEIGDQLRGANWDHSVSLDEIIADFDRVVMPGILNWGHPAFFGYFGSTSNTPALLGEMAAATLNVNSMTWKSSPSATEMETVVLEWIREICGLPEKHFGVVYDTASVAVTHALAAAREKACGGTRMNGLGGPDGITKLRIYASDQAHSSAEKAAIMLGVGESNVIRIPSDADFRMDCADLRKTILDDVAMGYTPMAVIATVGSTSTASSDPVPEIATICREFGLWLHVDAAYGGGYGVLPEGRWVMQGMEDADSVVVNPHKWLFVPLDFSTLYLKNPESVREVFSLTPEYLRGAAGESPAAHDYMDYGIQLGRRFRALKAWMVFRAFGRSGIESRIRENCKAAKLFAKLVSDEQHFSIATPVNMAVVCFRFEPPGLDDEAANAINRMLVEQVNASGQAFLTYTTLRGRIIMRAGFGNLLTTDATIHSVWDLIRVHAGELATGEESC